MSDLSLTQLSEIVGDDIEYWINNPFMPPEYVLGKVEWWLNQAIEATEKGSLR